MSPTATVVKGRDGWFFYGDDDALDDYANVEPLTPDGARELADGGAARARLAAAPRRRLRLH